MSDRLSPGDHQLTGVLGEVTDLLVEAERWHHGQGWDNTPPTLYCVCRSPAGDYQVVSTRLGQFTDGGAAHELALIADVAEDPTAGALLALAYPPHPHR